MFYCGYARKGIADFLFPIWIEEAREGKGGNFFLTFAQPLRIFSRWDTSALVFFFFFATYDRLADSSGRQWGLCTKGDQKNKYLCCVEITSFPCLFVLEILFPRDVFSNVFRTFRRIYSTRKVWPWLLSFVFSHLYFRSITCRHCLLQTMTSSFLDFPTFTLSSKFSCREIFSVKLRPDVIRNLEASAVVNIALFPGNFYVLI